MLNNACHGELIWGLCSEQPPLSHSSSCSAHHAGPSQSCPGCICFCSSAFFQSPSLPSSWASLVMGLTALIQVYTLSLLWPSLTSVSSFCKNLKDKSLCNRKQKLMKYCSSQNHKVQCINCSNRQTTDNLFGLANMKKDDFQNCTGTPQKHSWLTSFLEHCPNFFFFF